MYRKLEDFFEDYEELTQGTQKVLDVLDDSHLGQRIAEGHRSLGALAWHIAVTVPEMMSLTGLELSAVDHHAPPPNSARRIAEGYRSAVRELKAGIREAWTDASLLETDNLYGQVWPRGKTLSALIFHEIHHRAQAMVLLRQAGVKPPGLYGPAKEDWATMGMDAPAY